MPRPDKVSQLILEVLQENHALTAPDILQKLEDKGYEFNKTSVYRAIERLQESEQVCRYMFGGTTVVYERRDHHHDHLVCNVCGKIETVECSVHLPEEINGFHVNHHHLTMFGTCASCVQDGYSTPQNETLSLEAIDQIQPVETE